MQNIILFKLLYYPPVFSHETVLHPLHQVLSEVIIHWESYNILQP